MSTLLTKQEKKIQEEKKSVLPKNGTILTADLSQQMAIDKETWGKIYPGLSNSRNLNADELHYLQPLLKDGLFSDNSGFPRISTLFPGFLVGSGKFETLGEYAPKENRLWYKPSHNVGFESLGHEFTHFLQHVGNVPSKSLADAIATGTGATSTERIYNYGNGKDVANALKQKEPLKEFTSEQQAEIVHDYLMKVAELDAQKKKENDNFNVKISDNLKNSIGPLSEFTDLIRKAVIANNTASHEATK